MASEEALKRLRTAARQCPTAVSGQPAEPPADVLRGLAQACAELGIDEWDLYGAGGAVQRLEDELKERFDVEDAAFFPSGVMAQQSALRVHCDGADSRHVAMPDLSHLLVHEEDGPRILHDLVISFLTRGFEAPTAAHLEAVPGRLGAVLVELPLRDAGCLLPTWQELTELSAACRARGVPLHVDGARIWEAQPWFGQSLAEISHQADSMYVSFYKGLGGIAGAALLGSQDFVAEARVWRRRLGGTLYRANPEAVSALAGLRDRLPLIPDCVAWAQAFAAALPGDISVQPGTPQTNQFLLFATGDADVVNERTLEAIEQDGVGLPAWLPTTQPDRIQTEVVVTSAALGLGAAKMADRVARLVLPQPPT